MSKKLTPWFPHEVKPVRPGIYEAHWACGTWYCKWDGEWHWGSSTPRKALSGYPVRGMDVLIRWRGLAENPSPGAGD
ncbi:MAG TPA: hypothetical protein VN201_04730 [Roseateles sp.]|nr:hypothetical protein [Roseateles sp.]